MTLRFVLELLYERSILIETLFTLTKTVFILGAGASQMAGAPLMSEFLDVADHLWKTGAVTKREDCFKSVFKGIAALQDVHSKARLDFNNIESVFAAFEMASTLNRFPRHKAEDIEKLIHALKVVIVT